MAPGQNFTADPEDVRHPTEGPLLGRLRALHLVNSAFGMVVSDECRLKIQEHKTKQSFQFITLKINENTH
ncbi:hypothetical protein ZWY2020_037763 [Hordeum vulgare]|nr:hypothetical protein ZWY2020_037763 [Hordeum vulgare]